MIWRIGQLHGKMHQVALRSRSRWVEVLDQAKLPYWPEGSLHVVYRDDEAEVAREFAELAPGLGFECSWLKGDQVLARSGAVVADGLIGGFWSGMEPTVGSADLAAVETGNERWIVDRVIVCDGDDFETLYPETFTASRLTCVMLQMLRTAPQPEGWQLGPALAAGLTLRLYQASETAQGELTLGDSHEYGRCVNIFNRDEVDDLILGYIRGFLNAPVMQIAQRWHGVYAKHLERPYLATTPAPGVQIVTSPGSVGTTLAFGIAEETIEGMATENMEH